MPDDAHMTFNKPECLPHFTGRLFCVEREQQHLTVAIGQALEARVQAIQIHRVSEWRLL